MWPIQLTFLLITVCRIFLQTELDQPPWKNGQHQTPETRPQLQTSRKKRSWTPQETMAMRQCRNRSNDLNHGGSWRWWWWRYSSPTWLFVTLLSSHDRSDWSSPAFSSTTFQNLPGISDLLSELSKMQHRTKLRSKRSTLLVSSSYQVRLWRKFIRP